VRRPLTRQKLVQHRSQTVDIDPGAGRVRLVVTPFRSQIDSRVTIKIVGARLGLTDPHDRRYFAEGENDVRRFQITVNDAPLMSRVNRRG